LASYFDLGILSIAGLSVTEVSLYCLVSAFSITI